MRLKDIISSLLDPIRFVLWVNRSVDNAADMEMDYINISTLQRYMQYMFVAFSLAFNTIIPVILHTKLT